MKIDNLIKNLEKNVAEQDKTMQEQAQNVTEQHLTSYNELLRSSNKVTKKILTENINLIKESRTGIQKALAWKTMLGALMGSLVTTFLILLALNAWMGSNLKDKRAELAEITAKIEQSPLEAKALKKLEVRQNPDNSIWVVAKDPKKSRAGTNTNGKPSIQLE